MGEENPVSRRSFLTGATGAIGALIGAALGVPAVAYVVGPALQESQAQNWIRVGSISKVELGAPTLFKAKITNQTGWIVNEEEISIYIYTENGADFIALSNICTHLGCRVRWIDDQNQFFCPCHNAVFSKEGDVLAGPPPRPLDRYELKIEDDQIFGLGG